ncbi:MAG: TolC family outer membrane protein [Geminicoccaceae bacterium]|nr:TolC family outer membrane protein [Geminicoccaceae bacterium]MCS7266624.1 TolC family outer membrane protein [Geminicoccaceae bacterium]MCX7629248.1 TolC family outer membrane protein [Geminicoccaceae bacterium]MDW8123257.1 TolC family outer membrane protein [Geminicoccaceae bacterium]MDW8340442.1 TolC family outer membrane protein [Geminicoccaceae bacterium]
MRTSLAGAIAAALLLGTTPVAGETLEEALVEIYIGNPELAAARARLRATDELVPQALGGWRPTITLDAGVQGVTGQSRFAGTGIDQDTDRWSRSIAATLRQNLYAGGATTAATSRAENLVRAERANLLALEQRLFLDGVDAYTAVWRDRAVLDLALNNEQRLRRQLQATRDRFQVGEVARTDVAQAEARLSRARADVEAAKANLAASVAFYQRVVGREPGRLAKPVKPAGLPRSLAEARRLAENNPQVIAATFALAAARDDVDLSLAALLPSVDLLLRAERAWEPQATLSWSRQASIGLTVTVPLYQGGAEHARVRAARQTVEQRRNDLEASYRSVQQTVAASWDRLLAATAAIQAFRAEVRANDIALQGVQEENLVGARTVLDVLDAEQELFTSRVNLVRAERDEILAAYQLKAAIGQLTVEDLGLRVERYDPERNYRIARERLFGISIEPPPALAPKPAAK